VILKTTVLLGFISSAKAVTAPGLTYLFSLFKSIERMEQSIEAFEY